MLELLKAHRFPIAFVGLSLLTGTMFYGNRGVMSYSPLVSPFGIFANIIDGDAGGSGDALPKCDSRLVSKELLRLMNDTPQARRGGFEAKKVLSAQENLNGLKLETFIFFESYLKDLKIYNQAEIDKHTRAFGDTIHSPSKATPPDSKKVIDEYIEAYTNQFQRKCSLQVATNAGEKTVSLEITWADEKSKRPKYNATWR